MSTTPAAIRRTLSQSRAAPARHTTWRPPTTTAGRTRTPNTWSRYRYEYPDEETSRTAASRIATQYSYTFWTGTDTVKTRTTTLPTVSSSENGSGSATTTVDYYDDRGRLRWTKDGVGQVTYYSYHPENGQLAYTRARRDPTSLPSSADSNSTKWVTSSDGSASSNKPTRGAGLPTAVEQVTRQEFDDQGRADAQDRGRRDRRHGPRAALHGL